MKKLTLAKLGPRVSDILLALSLLFLVLVLADASHAQSGSPYGYVRTLEGEATLVPADDEEEPFTTSINQPVLPGDRLYVEPGARLEVVLPEGTRVRAGDGAELEFAVLGTEGDEGPRLLLLDGELQLTSPDATASSATPRIDTSNASVYAVDPGQFSVRVRGAQDTLVTVRSGTVEVRTPRGVTTLRPDDALSVEGGEWADAELVHTPAWSSLEIWGYDLDQQIADARIPEELADDLAYDSAPLDRNGDWVDVEGSYAWRPSVDYDWRPYTAGHWYYTPSGLSWVSREPWGWVTYHYGSWDWAPRYGWVWYPARQWAPAWVYWYWGPDYVGWCPTGVYARYYGRSHHYGSFRWGSYGWSRGHWNDYKHWNFISHGRLHDRHLGRDAYRRAADTRPGGRIAVPRGFITTDTSGLSRTAWEQPGEAADVLARRAVATRPGTSRAELPDVTSFVARSADLSPEVARRVITREPGERTISAPSPGRQALRRVGSVVPQPAAAPGRAAVVRTPSAGGRAVVGDDAIRPSVGDRDGAVSRGGETWRRSADSPAAGTRTPTARSVRTPSRSVSASPPSGSTDRGRAARGAPADSPVRARPPVSRSREGSDSRVREVPDSRSDWRRDPSVRPAIPRDGTANRTPDSSPPVRRVIDAVRGAPAAPPARRAAPPRTSRPSSHRGAAPRATAPPRSAPQASPARPVTRRPGVGATPPSRSTPRASSSPRSSSSPRASSRPRSSSRPRASSSPPSRSGGSSSRGVSSRSSSSPRASSPPPRQQSSSSGGESRGRASSTRRGPD